MQLQMLSMDFSTNCANNFIQNTDILITIGSAEKKVGFFSVSVSVCLKFLINTICYSPERE